MRTQELIRHLRVQTIAVSLATMLMAFGAAGSVFTQTAAAPQGKAFASASEAADALIAAAGSYDTAALLEILGPDSRDIIQTADPVTGRQNATEFAEQAKAKKAVAVDKRNKARAFLSVGEESWPFPVPIVKKGTSWYFDTAAGRQEILLRRVGRNELDAIDISRGYVEAQHEYALTRHDDAVVNQYAQKIISTPGKKDGLAWQNPDGTWGGSVGETIGKALQDGHASKNAPFRGYFYKVITKQGPSAPLGALDFVQKGAMIGGFALVAYPAVYQVTGVKTFMVSHDGVVYEKDFGPKTTELAAAIDAFNPDRTWTPVKEDN